MTTNPTPYSRPRPFQRVYADTAKTLVAAIREHREDLERSRKENDDESILAILGPLGESYRLLGELDLAVACGEEALALAEKLLRPKHMISNGIRLATALQYRNEQSVALTLFNATQERARAHGYLVDMVLQHQGKCLVELGRIDEAIACFEEALSLRRERADQDLIASTEEALAGARQRRPS